MPRFVILTHDHPSLHWDFMLEHGPVLRTWRLLQSPDMDGPIEAEPLPDHRLAYLDYEGPVSRGRGEVKRWDAGEYEEVESEEDRIVVRLAGKRVKPIATLQRLPESLNWSFNRGS
jgi:hypothetical protein